MKRIILLAVIFAGLTSVSGATVHQINIFDFGFNPTSKTITEGDTVRWTNTGPSTHTSTSDQGSLDPWNSGNLSTNQSYQRQFNVVGIFGYHCTPHSFMTGTIEVDQATGVDDPSGPIVPLSFKIDQNYPNPFNAATTIQYQLPKAGEVRLTIYNLLGQIVKVFQPGRQAAGSYTISWDGKDRKGSQVGSGIYLYRLEAGEFSQFRKMTLIK